MEALVPQLASVASGFLHNAFSYPSFEMWPICPLALSFWPFTLIKGITSKSCSPSTC